MKMLNRFKTALAALALLGLVIGAVQAAPATPTTNHRSSQPQTLDRIVAVVNDGVITQNQLNARVRSATMQLHRQKVQLPPADILRQQVLDQMVTERAQVQAAKEAGIQVDDAELEQALIRVAANQKMTPQQMRQTVEKDGVTWPEFREEIRNQMMIARVREREVDAKINVSPGEVDNFLANQGAAGAGEEVHIAHIVIRIPEGASPETLNKLRMKAVSIDEQARAGRDFAQLAATYSESNDALQGGDLGFRPVDSLPQVMSSAIANLKPGQVSDVVRSPSGFHIVKLIARKGGSALPQVQQTHARHILIKVTEVTSEAEARQKIGQVHSRLKSGEDFAALAKLYSQDGSAQKGGDLGWLYPGDTVPAFDQAMNALKVGEISNPVQTQFGFHIIQVLERRTTDVSQERQRQRATMALRQRKMEEANQEWVRQVRDRAYVEIRLDDQ
ncbi:peptidylprolyl isomerase [Fluviibacter phosphoraccumulans]|jgi:peptidyl-prolyl cis-trans isomerase SurA|uniref:Chaperone SurA n=1 Tax=Fluviibacter phosphoraccumulans TaxID=1751046 RepID=A0A679I7C0_9RHOO|nr:peptidylprolyl isomerase [Fluviibacter phosphoraccumulans]BBU67730.1 chaperone SurA [Fluviibacter phosphoraccumulans]BBU70731.1 chaperone SurA [Fluviibacter phosphoraccumulans]BCA65914.1 chaperone SurA [Fluviibacter phosphoraccumulans]